MSLLEISRKNWKKKLKELDISKYPSLPEYIKNVRLKLIKKQDLTFIEERITLPKIVKYIEEFTKAENKLLGELVDWNKFSNRPPFEFQKVGILHFLENERCINADEMGLGKSIQAIIASKSLPDDWNILIVTTKSLKYNFANEIAFFDDRISIIEKKWLPNKYTLIHYDSVKKWAKEIIASRFEVLIFDEAHKLSNVKSKRTANIINILAETKTEIKKVWCLTGTPISNRPISYYNLLKICKHPISKNYIHYVTRYCNGFQDEVYGGWNASGASNLLELHEKTKDLVIRRKKKDTLVDFPEKNRRSILLNLSNKESYLNSIELYKKKKFHLLSSSDQKLLKNKDVNALTKLIIWRQYCALEKINDGSLLDLIDNEILKENKIIVASNFTSVLDFLQLKLGPKICSVLDGRIEDPKDRLRLVEEFNLNDEKKVIALNMKVGSVGYNITSANALIVNDMHWNPDEMKQVEDRSWRIGQVRDVDVLYPTYLDTVEEYMYDIILKKSEITSTVIDGVNENFFNEEEFDETLETNSFKLLLEKIDNI